MIGGLQEACEVFIRGGGSTEQAFGQNIHSHSKCLVTTSYHGTSPTLGTEEPEIKDTASALPFKS